MNKININQLIKHSLGLILLITLVANIVVAEEPSSTTATKDLSPTSLEEAFTMGKAKLFMRARYEHDNQVDLPKEANAVTMLTRVSYETAEYQNFLALLELEDISPIGNESYNSTTNGKTEYPIVADPNVTQVNQAFLSYTGIADTTLRGGRQVITLDSQRFVGEVAWRQNNQTFDGISLANDSFEKTKLFYSWIYQVNKIFGEDSEQGVYNSQIHLMNLNHQLDTNSFITPFIYLLDLQNADEKSGATYGARFNGSLPISDSKWSVPYDLSYALQKDYADSPTNFSQNYYLIESGLQFDKIVGKAGYEVLGSDQGVTAFQTPLATLHAFNGWADKFLLTPVNGLADLYLSLGVDLSMLNSDLTDYNATLVFHDFNSEYGSQDYGNEWDFNLAKQITPNYSVVIRYAHYMANDLYTDTEKVWVGFMAKFGN